MQDDIKRLAAYNAAKAVPAPKATPGQLGYKAYEIRWNSLHKDAPGKTPPWEEKK
jgi:hypothetical protein